MSEQSERAPLLFASAERFELRVRAVDGTSVYGFNYGSSKTATGAVVKVPLDGGTPVTLATGQSEPGSIAVDANSVYWIVQQSGSDPVSGKVMKLTPK